MNGYKLKMIFKMFCTVVASVWTMKVIFLPSETTYIDGFVVGLMLAIIWALVFWFVFFKKEGNSE